MKKNLLTLFSMLVSMCSFAQLQGDGYYRIENLGIRDVDGIEAYSWITDDEISKAQLSSGTGQNLDQILIVPGLEEAQASPASVIYVKQYGSGYDLQAQGTGVNMILQKLLGSGSNYYVSPTRASNGSNCYTVSATYGTTLYLQVGGSAKSGIFYASTVNNSNVQYRKWAIHPISSTSETQFVAVKPTLELNGKYYAPYYASYPFRLLSSGMRAYYVSELSANGYTLKLVETDVIPAATPVLIECSSKELKENKIEPVEGTYPSISGNKLVGCYFCNLNRATETYPNCRKQFDPQTMRVWNVENGELVLSTATDYLTNYTYKWESYYCINANSSYVDVSGIPGAESCLRASELVGIKNVTKSVEQQPQYYTIEGKHLSAPQKGLNIVKYANGKNAKILVGE